MTNDQFGTIHPVIFINAETGSRIVVTFDEDGNADIDSILRQMSTSMGLKFLNLLPQIQKEYDDKSKWQ